MRPLMSNTIAYQASVKQADYNQLPEESGPRNWCWTICELGARFWVPKGRRLVRNLISLSCMSAKVKCKTSGQSYSTSLQL